MCISSLNRQKCTHAGECGKENHSGGKTVSDEEESNNDSAINSSGADGNNSEFGDLVKQDGDNEAGGGEGDNQLVNRANREDDRLVLGTIHIIAIASASFVVVFLLTYCILKYKSSDQGTYSIDEKHGPFAQLEPLSKHSLSAGSASSSSIRSCSKAAAKRKKTLAVKAGAPDPNKEWFV